MGEGPAQAYEKARIKLATLIIEVFGSVDEEIAGGVAVFLGTYRRGHDDPFMEGLPYPP